MSKPVGQVKQAFLDQIDCLKWKVARDYRLAVEKITIGFVQIDMDQRESEEEEERLLHLHLMFMENGMGHHYWISVDPKKVAGRFDMEVVAGWCREWGLTSDIRVKNGS